MMRTHRHSTATDVERNERREMFGLSPAELNCFEPDWRISEELLGVLCELLRLLQPDSILETGAGASSLLFFHYQRTRPETQFYSHDESGCWNERLMGHVERLGFASSGITASSIRAGFYERTAPGIEVHRPFDLILYDGPSAFRHRASSAGRAFLLQNGSRDSVYVIDDSNRPRVASIVSLLQEQFGNRTFQPFHVRDRTFRWRVSTVLVPQEKVSIVHQSTVWRELAMPASP